MSAKAPSINVRIAVACVVVLLWCGGIVYRLIDLQIVQNDSMTQRSDELHFEKEAIPARRGEILDASGKIMAISLEEPFIFADPSRVKDPKATAVALGKIFGWSKKQRATHQKAMSREDRYFHYLARRASKVQVAAVKELDLAGIHIDKEVWRHYPNEWIGSHIVGFKNQDGTSIEGMERVHHQVMTGEPGLREVMRDGRRRRNSLESTLIRKPEIGANVALTLDTNIQMFAEQALRKALKKNKARNITAIVLDVESGAIRAMANAPDFNPNRFSKFSGFARKNRAVIDAYDPASAFKIVTVAAAIDAGVLSPSEVFHCNLGGITVEGLYIKDNKRFADLTTEEILWYSSNVGSIKIADKMTRETFHSYIKAFGFGEKTGIDLPAESSGILAEPADWSGVSKAFLSMGHEISATPLQMLMAASVVANDGMLVKPYLTEKIIHGDGTEVSMRPEQEPRRVIRAETARMMREMLKGVVYEGTAKAAQIAGVDVFGKTGTAQRLDRGRYSNKRYNASFVGFFPAESPRYGMIVVVHDPQGGRVHGGEVAAPIFAEIGQMIVQYEQARKPQKRLVMARVKEVDKPLDPLPRSRRESMPDLSGMGSRGLARRCQRMGLKLEIRGEGRVVSQLPAAGSPIPKDRVCIVQLKEG